MPNNSYAIYKISGNEWELDIKDNTGLYHFMHLNQEKLSYIVNDLTAKGYTDCTLEELEVESYVGYALDDFDYLDTKACAEEDLEEEDFE